MRMFSDVATPRVRKLIRETIYSESEESESESESDDSDDESASEEEANSDDESGASSGSEQVKSCLHKDALEIVWLGGITSAAYSLAVWLSMQAAVSCRLF